MAIIYYTGDTPILEAEALQKQFSGEILKFSEAITNDKEYEIKFRNGIIKSSNKSLKKNTPIGIGKPLSIEILTIYSGDAPERFLGKKDLLVTSGIKSIAAYKAASLAVNQIAKKISDKKNYSPSALNEGCPIVYYTPALEMGTLFISFHLIADTFNNKVFEEISGLLGKAGAVPIFAPAAGILLASSVITKTAGNFGKTVFESKPFFQGDFTVRLDSPGQPITLADQIAITDSKHQKELTNFVPGLVNTGPNKTEIRLVHRNTKKEYQGNAPYILVSIDGRERKELDSFKPTFATASILEEFYGTQSAGTASIDTIEQAVELYNDFNYYNKANDLKDTLKDLPKGSKEHNDTNTLLEAYKKNILKPEIFKI